MTDSYWATQPDRQVPGSGEVGAHTSRSAFKLGGSKFLGQVTANTPISTGSLSNPFQTVVISPIAELAKALGM